MTKKTPGGPLNDRRQTRQAKLAALVIVVAMLVWLGAQGLIVATGLSSRLALLVDLSALAAFVWALIVIVGVWRKRRADEDA